MKAVIDMLGRSVVPLSAIAITFAVVIVVIAGASVWWLVMLLLTVPALVLSAVDFFRPDWNVGRSYPGAAHIRNLAYDLRPFLRQYIVEGDLEGTPYSFEARNLVNARARGKADPHPFGSEREMQADGYQWFSHSMAPAANPDLHPRVTVGSPQCSKPYDASVLNISAMSFGALSGRAIEALNLGAKLGDFYHDTGEGGLSPYHLKHGGDVVWELGSGYFGARDSQGRFDAGKFRERAQKEAVKMTEIKLSQGAKPGHGGLLPGAKVTAEIAETRQIPEGQDCLSPRGHSAFSSPVQMLEFAAQMRDLSGGKPVGVKFCVGQPHEVMALMKAMLKTGVYLDFIVVDGAEGGTGAAPLELSDWVGMPLVEGLVIVQNALVGAGLRDHVKLAASGKIFSAAGLARNLAIGADWCNAARSFMFSIGCIQARRCHTGTCPTGITTQDPLRQRAVVPSAQGPNAARFHEKTLHALADIVAGAGLEHPRDLRPHHLTTRVNASEAREFGELHHFLKDGELRDDPGATPYAAWWAAANADSFAPQADIHDIKTLAKNVTGSALSQASD